LKIYYRNVNLTAKKSDAVWGGCKRRENISHLLLLLATEKGTAGMLPPESWCP